MPKSKISKPEVKQPRVVLRSSAAEILSAYDKHIYSVEQALQMLGVSRPTFFRRLKAGAIQAGFRLTGTMATPHPTKFRMKRANGSSSSFKPSTRTSRHRS